MALALGARITKVRILPRRPRTYGIKAIMAACQAVDEGATSLYVRHYKIKGASQHEGVFS
jgi:hypothetical protein